MAHVEDGRIAATAREQRPLTQDRIEAIRASLEAGAYASAAVLQATARAILEQRDV